MKITILTIFLSIFNSYADSRIKIAVIDSGISKKQYHSNYMCNDPVVNLTKDSSYLDDIGHGTNIVSIISPSLDPKKQCIIMYKTFSKNKGENNQRNINNALFDIIKDDSIKILNMSLYGKKYSGLERLFLERILKKGVQITVSAGNDGDDLDIECNSFPACYRKEPDFKYSNFYVVGSFYSFSNRGDVITDIYPGKNIGTPLFTGTSQSTAQKTAKLVKDMVYNNRRKK